MKNLLFWLILVVGLLVGFIAGGILGYNFGPKNTPTVAAVAACPVCEKIECPDCVCGTEPEKAAATEPDPCYEKARDLGAPEEMVFAICDAKPDGDGVSDALPAGTFIPIGSITFDSEWRVWFLRDFTVPMKASYAFDYKGAERNIFDSGFVNGTDLGYLNDERVPFTICWDTEGECSPSISLFPDK